MNDIGENTFWAVVMALIAAVVIVIVAAFPLYYSARNATVAEMVKSGANPLDAVCAIENFSAACVVRATK